MDAAVAAARAETQSDDVEFDHLKADALVGLITGARTTGRRVPDLTLLADARTLREGRHDDTVCETADGHPLPVETMRRHGCDATITPIVIDNDGVPLNVGRTAASPPPTNLDNLLPMCERHHHHVHEGGWTLTLKPDRTITLRRPDGTLHHEATTTTNHTNHDPRPPPTDAA